MNEQQFQELQRRCDASRGKLKNRAGGAMDWASASHEKQQDVDKGPTNHKSKKARVDGEMYRSFRVTITLRYSDRRARDIDGAASTLLDCVQHACKRL